MMKLGLYPTYRNFVVYKSICAYPLILREDRKSRLTHFQHNFSKNCSTPLCIFVGKDFKLHRYVILFRFEAQFNDENIYSWHRLRKGTTRHKYLLG